VASGSAAITIEPNGTSTVVLVTNDATAANAALFSDATLTASVSNGAAITATTTYYVATPNPYTVSCKVNGVEQANSANTTRSQRLSTDQALIISVSPTFSIQVVTDTTTTPYTAAANETVLVTATAGNKVVNLPAVASGAVVTVKKIDSSVNTVTMTPASGLIDGAATKVLSTQWAGFTVRSNGTDWFIVSAF
jgi:hypothetical protein